MNHQHEKSKEFYPIILTLVLFIIALLVFFICRLFPNSSLWIPICFYMIDVGFVISLILGARSKEISFKLFSILSNVILIIPLSIVLYLLLLANGISEP